MNYYARTTDGLIHILDRFGRTACGTPLAGQKWEQVDAADVEQLCSGCVKYVRRVKWFSEAAVVGEYK